jgi:hypothetical protein
VDVRRTESLETNLLVTAGIRLPFQQGSGFEDLVNLGGLVDWQKGAVAPSIIAGKWSTN